MCVLRLKLTCFFKTGYPASVTGTTLIVYIVIVNLIYLLQCPRLAYVEVPTAANVERTSRYLIIYPTMLQWEKNYWLGPTYPIPNSVYLFS